MQSTGALSTVWLPGSRSPTVVCSIFGSTFLTFPISTLEHASQLGMGAQHFLPSVSSPLYPSLARAPEILELRHRFLLDRIRISSNEIWSYYMLPPCLVPILQMKTLRLKMID
jgi:hypothetical protein